MIRVVNRMSTLQVPSYPLPGLYKSFLLKDVVYSRDRRNMLVAEVVVSFKQPIDLLSTPMPMLLPI